MPDAPSAPIPPARPSAPIPPARRPLPLVAAAALTLAVGGWAGLVRSGWPWPAPGDGALAGHGALLVSGFVAALIAFERAIVLRRRWADLAPLGAVAGAVATVLAEPRLAALLTLGGALALGAVYVAGLRRQPTLSAAIMLAGAAGWAGGALAWASGGAAFTLVPWWIAFLTLTIAGERLELSRLTRPSGRARAAFVAACALAIAAAAVTLASFDLGLRLLGVALLGIAAYLGRHDLAPRNVRKTGLVRFIALAVTSSYVWLAVAGAQLILYDGIPAGLRWDALVHSFMLGFAVVMIFGHAPIILPAVLGVAIGHRPSFYAHLALLHVALVLRVGGDLLGSADARQWGGLLSGVAVLVFLENTLVAARARRPIPAVPGR